MSKLNRTTEFSNKYSFLQYRFIFSDFAYIKSFLDKSKKLLEDSRREVESKIVKWDEIEDPPSYRPGGFDKYEMELNNVAYFPELIHNSLLITSYSLFENGLYKLCVECQKVEEIIISPNDLKSDGILKYRTYLRKVLMIDLSTLNVQWEKIRKYQTIRNSIVHHDGVLKDKKKELLTFIEESDGISISEKHIISIDSVKYLKSMISDFEKFMDSVCEEILNQKKV